MSTQPHDRWPTADLDPVRRLHIMAAGIPGMHVEERVIPIPFTTVWGLASDLEYELPRLGGGYVIGFRYTSIDGERREALVHGPLGIRDRFRIILRPGWCWMEGHVLCAGMAATPVANGTLFAWASGVMLPGGRLMRPIARPILRRTLRRLEEHARQTDQR